VIAGITGLKDRVVRHYLKALLEEGLVERTTKQTQSINAKYRALEPPRQASLFETKLQGQQ
jgi:DNA-binding HxlR family transcriptional regulator